MHQAKMILDFFGIDFGGTKDSVILVNKTNYQTAIELLDDLKSKKPKPPKTKKIPVQDKRKSGPKTKASQGLERYFKINATINPEAREHLLSEQHRDNNREWEIISHTLNRLILEHKRLTDPDKEIAEMAYRTIS